MAGLRKRLGNAGVDLSNPKLNESFVLIGTPLPPLEKTNDNNEFVPLWKQEVRDEQGRRRLHGAFTGGFSAGYFNTVGSKEGWAPSTFKSSRNDRGSNKVMRPEDFMDDEDLAELQESRKLVDQETAIQIQETRGLHASDDSFSAALANILPPVNESVGAAILKKMGWRPGQGIGPRLTYEQLKRRSELDGTPLPAVEDAEALKHTYAPRDTKPLQVLRKDGFHGLGYTPVMGLRSSSNQQTEVSGPRLSSGFGLGALNDAEEDDVDVYDDGLPSGGRRLAFEAEDDEDERIRSSKAAPSGSNEPKFQSVGFFRGGIPLLPGFVIVDLPMPAAKKFDPPDVPEGWTPDPNRVWGSTRAEEPSNTTGDNSASSHHQWKVGISADERGSILGEQQLTAAKRSIWDYLSSKDRERLQSLKNNPTASNAVPVRPTPVQVIDVPRTNPAIAKAALVGFQPFKDDPRKQARYSAYLGSQASSQPMELQPLPGQSIEDFNAELEGFAKAAKIFKPMSAAMASRFRTSTGPETMAQPQEGLYQPTDEAYAQHEAKTQSVAEKMEVEETPKEHAAKMGMFGAMTREKIDWVPAKLLCKRFRVPPPKVADSDAKEHSNPTQFSSSSYPAASLASMELDAPVGDHIRVIPAESVGTSDSGGRRDMANIGLGEDDTQGRETLTYERPAMDIFKAIFASDDESSEGEVEAKDTSKQSDESTQALVGSSATVSASKALADTVSATESGPVDLTTFRPTFVARSRRDKPVKDSNSEKPQKPSKKRPKAPVSLSFMEDDAGLTVAPVVKKRKRDKDPEGKSAKKREKESEKASVETTAIVVDEDDDNMWVEKAPTTAVQQPPAAAPDTSEKGLIPTGKSRPRASDFL